ncbi:MAG: histidine-type phosphatase [Rickettsiales bacterium]|nr:histidine-type phosphatase [Rickettsiales bacterium]
MKKILSFIFLFCFITLNSYFAFANENHKLVFALDLVRHGDRGPTKYMPEISKAWTKDEILKITPLGKKQAELLGKDFKEYYIHKTHLLPKNFSSELMQINSTNCQRTEETAKAILKGMYPTTYDIARVIPTKEDFLNSSRYKKQKKQRNLIKKEIIKNATPSYIITGIQNQLRYINNVFNTNFSTIKDFSRVSGVIRVSEIHNRPLLKSLPKSSIKEILDLKRKLILNNFTYPKLICLYGKDFILHVANLLKTKQYNKKYFLYAAHDTNILTAMPLLNYKLKKTPSYLSNLRFEVFQNTKNGNLFVKTSLDNKDIKVCKSSYVCPLEEFVTTLKNNVQNKCNKSGV